MGVRGGKQVTGDSGSTAKARRAGRVTPEIRCQQGRKWPRRRALLQRSSTPHSMPDNDPSLPLARRSQAVELRRRSGTPRPRCKKEG
jgi:hypothetical protein